MTIGTGVRTRRDFVVVSALTFAGVGCVVALLPFVDQMHPNRSSARDTVDVDLSQVQFGQLQQVRWKQEPLLVRRRTPQEVELARRVLLTDLTDPYARVQGVGERTSAIDANRTKVGHDNWLVVIGVCTYCRCLVKASDRDLALRADEAFFCPCCNSRFDLAGRASAGPARQNLVVPPYRFLTPTKMQIG
jgi:ubiquinol-cytochrome c reductase iron-sulfur subunit